MAELSKIRINNVDYDLKDATARQNSGGNVAYDTVQNLTDAQKAQARDNIGAQPKGNYLTEVPSGYAKTEDIPTDSHINSLIDAKLAQFTNVAEVGAFLLNH